MSTLPKKIGVKAGDSLASIADELFGDYSMWRELSDFNNIDIFKALEITQSPKLTVPTKDEAERRYKDVAASVINDVNNDIQTNVKNIINSREFSTITKLLGISVDQDKLLKDLDLSSLAKNIAAPTKGERLRNALNVSSYEKEIPVYRLIDWVL